MALYNCYNSIPLKRIIVPITSHTRLTNGSAQTAAYTVSISEDDVDDQNLYVIVQYYVSNSTVGGWNGKGSVSAGSNVEWLKLIYDPQQSNSNSLVYRAMKIVLVKPENYGTKTTVKFTTATGYGKLFYYVYKVEPYLFYYETSTFNTRLFRCGGKTSRSLPAITGNSTVVSVTSSTTGDKTLTWIASSKKLYVAAEMYLSNGTGHYTTFSAPTASANVEWLYSMASGYSTSESLNARAHRITFIKPEADGDCSIYYKSETSNGRIYYWVIELSPDVTT